VAWWSNRLCGTYIWPNLIGTIEANFSLLEQGGIGGRGSAWRNRLAGNRLDSPVKQPVYQLTVLRYY